MTDWAREFLQKEFRPRPQGCSVTHEKKNQERYETAMRIADRLEQAEKILAHVFPHLPGAVLTCDMSTCEMCGTAVTSGMKRVCINCLRKEIREYLQGGKK